MFFASYFLWWITKRLFVTNIALSHHFNQPYQIYQNLRSYWNIIWWFHQHAVQLGPNGHGCASFFTLALFILTRFFVYFWHVFCLFFTCLCLITDTVICTWRSSGGHFANIVLSNPLWIRALISKYFWIKQLDVITHPRLNFSGSLTKSLLKIGHGYIIASLIRSWMWLLIHALISSLLLEGGPTGHISLAISAYIYLVVFHSNLYVGIWRNMNIYFYFTSLHFKKNESLCLLEWWW